MYQYQSFSDFFGNGGRPGRSMPPERTKDPYAVLGVSPTASQAQIKAAYRRLAMKYHPDRVRCDGSDEDGGEAAKKRASAKFAEISAAYELLTSASGAREGGSGASHPSFAATTAAPTSRYPEKYDYQAGMDPFYFDSFGVGRFDDFSDPFDLFRRTFGDIGAFNDDGMGIFPSFVDGPSSPAMAAPAFGGFTSFDSMMNTGLPAHSSSCFSSSTYRVGGAQSGGPTSRMVSTTTTVINGKAVTRREETVANPDGTTTTTVSSTGGTEDEQQRQFKRRAIRADNDVHGRIENDRVFKSQPSEDAATTSKSHSRGYKIESKQHLKEEYSGILPLPIQPVMPSDETHIIDLTEDDDVDIDLSVDNARRQLPEKRNVEGTNEECYFY